MHTWMMFRPLETTSKIFSEWIWHAEISRLPLELYSTETEIIWPRLDGPALEAKEVDLHFSLLHNLLGVLANQHHWRLADSPACLFCRPAAAAETVLHFFTSCTRTSAAWHFLLFRATVSLGRTLTDEALLFLAWPPSAARVDDAVVLAVITFTSWAWTTRTSSDVLVPHDLQLRLRRAAEGGPLYSIL